MKKWLKILIAVIATPIVLLFIFACYYVITNWQGVIEPYQVGNQDSQYKVLIASQGSEFKDKLLLELVQQLKSDTVYMSIVDCTSLAEEAVTDWDAIVIIHASQAHGMPKSARAFLESFPDHSKVILVTTSGGGDEKINEFEVDAVSTASRLSSTDMISDWAVAKVKHILSN